MDQTLNFKGRRALDLLQEKYPTLYFFGDLIVNIAVVVVLVYTVRTYVISPFQVYGPSMCDTLNRIEGSCQQSFGEYLIVNKALYYPFFNSRYAMPERGDIVVFRPPGNSKDFYIKRIIGLPGEKVKIESGKVKIFNDSHPDGWEIPEPYLNANNKNQTYPLLRQSPAAYDVPKDTFFVLGDNRKQSTDSRSCFRPTGDRQCESEKKFFLPIDMIEGKAWVVLWPFNRIRLLTENPYG